MANKDVYLNIAGGLRINEPAADMAVAAAVLSSITEVPVPPSCVVFGEVGLSGEVRTVAQTEARLAEADKLGFTAALLPPLRGKAGESSKSVAKNLKTYPFGTLMDLVTHFSKRAAQKGKPMEMAED